jgi:mRNA turnover protein 4
LGRNKIIAHALGTDESSEYMPQLHHMSEALKGNVALIFTNRDIQEVIHYFEEYSQKDYARSGFVATSTVELPAGPLLLNGEPFPHSLESQVRKLGMPTQLKNGVVTLTATFNICQEGGVLTPEQGRLLKMFLIKMSEFKLRVHSYWSKKDASFHIL